MINTWSPAVPAMLAALLLGVLPGAAIGACAGFRRFTLLGIAPLLSSVTIGGSAIAAAWLHLAWGVVPLVLGLASAVLATLLLRWVLRKAILVPAEAEGGSLFPLRFRWPTLGALIIAAAVLGYRMLTIFRSPDYVSQTADNVFHLNAVRYILQSGNGSTLYLNAASAIGVNEHPTSLAVYPAGWHDLVALVVQVCGSSIPVAVSGVNVVIAAVFWPISAIFLARLIFGNSKVVDIVAGILVTSFSAFPYLLVDWGVLYPNFYGMAILPGFVGLCFMVGQKYGVSSRQRVTLCALLGVSVLGLLTVHPNTLLSALVVVVPLWLFQTGTLLKRIAINSGPSWRLVRFAGSAFLLGAGLILLWVKLRPFPISSYETTWPPYESVSQAVGEFLMTTHSGWNPGYVGAALLALGLATFLRRPQWRWLLVSTILWGIVFVAVAAYQPSPLRATISGGWFDDYRRIAAGYVVTALLVAVGAARESSYWCLIIARRFRRRGVLPAPFSTRFASLLIPIAIVLALAAVTQKSAISQASAHAATNYSLQAGSPIMSASELSLYDELDSYVPPDAVIADNPWDGSAWAYFVSGRHVLFPHVLTAWTPDSVLIAQKLNQVATDPAVCAAVKRLNVKYAINSDELIYLPGNPENMKYPGIAGLDHATGFSLVASVGGNRLYKVTSCW